MNARHAVGAWGRFWYTPQPTSSLALFRIAVGTVTLAWTLALLPGLRSFFTASGIEPEPVGVTWGLLGHFTSNTAVFVTYGVLLVCALAVIVGFHTRLASIVMFVTLFAFIERAHPIFNSGDGLLRILSFFLIFMPAGEALSVDRWRRDREHFWDFPARAPWALRLVQVQISVLYLSSVHHKLIGGMWTDGSALSYVWRMDDLVRFHVPDVVVRSITLSTLLAFMTVVIELMIGVLVWVKSARPLVLALGVGLHVGIDLSLRIGFFSVAIIASYLAFLDPDMGTKVILGARDAVRTRQLPFRRAEEPEPAP